MVKLPVLSICFQDNADFEQTIFLSAHFFSYPRSCLIETLEKSNFAPE